MNDVYLRFATKAEADAKLPPYTNVDRIGVIYLKVGDIDVLPTPGYHVNVRLIGTETLEPALVPYQVPTPATPERVWA